MAFTFVAPAFAGGGPPDDSIPPLGKGYAEGEAEANVVSLEIVGPSKPLFVDLDTAQIQVIATFDSSASAEAGAKALLGKTWAEAYAYADGLVTGEVTSPSGAVVGYQFFLEGNSDWEYNKDFGWMPKSYASADAKFDETVVLTFSIPVTEEGTYNVYAFADTIAYFFAQSGWKLLWFGDSWEASGWDYDWMEAFFQFYARYKNYPNMRLDFMVDPGCVVEITPYADYGTGRLGSRTFEKAAYIHDDPYVPGGLKYEPASFELLGGVVYKVELWCPVEAKSPLGAGIVASADFHIGGIHDGYQKIWAPFHNAAPGVFSGFHVTGGVE